MLDSMIKIRFSKLQSRYMEVKTEAKRLMKEGDISNYIQKLSEAQKLHRQLVETFNQGSRLRLG
ncbi:MAG: hypothetical protein EA412_08795 [Chitinophagaceae bacterium]|nr:MAG: hypothetical protein EA412_08795 [Chitinophagaceae bacterium]